MSTRPPYGADGSGAGELYLKTFEIKHLPYVWYDGSKDDEPIIKYPQMNGKKVFKHAVTRMPQAIMEGMIANGLKLDEIDMVIPHQANLRINQMIGQMIGLPPQKTFEASFGSAKHVRLYQHCPPRPGSVVFRAVQLTPASVVMSVPLASPMTACEPTADSAT